MGIKLIPMVYTYTASRSVCTSSLMRSPAAACIVYTYIAMRMHIYAHVHAHAIPNEQTRIQLIYINTDQHQPVPNESPDEKRQPRPAAISEHTRPVERATILPYSSSCNCYGGLRECCLYCCCFCGSCSSLHLAVWVACSAASTLPCAEFGAASYKYAVVSSI